VTTGKVKKTRILNTLAVSETATLQLNENADDEIANVSLAARTTLALPNSRSDSFMTRDISSVTLPSSGTVNMVIDGEPLSNGTYTIFSCIPENYGNFIVSGTAIAGRTVGLIKNGSTLTLSIPKPGMIISIR
jgi:hypothetical protein